MPLTLRQRILAIGWLAIIYVFLEWLFLVTKPSFFNYFSWLKNIEIFFIGTLLFFTFLLTLFFLVAWAFWTFDKFIFRKIGFISNVQQDLLNYLLSLVLLILSMLLIDDFSYTLFQLGIIDTTSTSRILYCLFLVAVFVTIVRTIRCLIARK